MSRISKKLAIAIQHHQAGRLQSAEQICRQIMLAKPKQADAIHLLGVIARQSGKHGVAAVYFELAAFLDEDSAEFHYDSAEACRVLRRTPEAVACYRRTLELRPDHAEAHCKLGSCSKELGLLDEALACCRRALELKPGYSEAHYTLGTVLMAQGKLGDAVDCFRRALESRPDYAEAYNCLGIAVKDQGNLDEALKYWHRALELKPDFAEAHSNLGIALQETGDLQGAEDSFRAALRHDYRFTVPHYKLADLQGGKLSEKDLASQRLLLKDMDLTDAQRLLLHFGLAQVLDARGEYAEAAEHLDRGNTLKRSDQRKCGRGYDPMAYEILITQMIGTCTPDFFERVRGFGSESETPVFVVGLPRSGTTLVEQILAAHSRVFGAGETKLVADTMAALGGPKMDSIEGLRQLDRATACNLASLHLERLRASDREALRIVDKMPDNYVYLGLLASLFPRAKFIHCRRDLRDVAVSCWMTNFLEVRWSNDKGQIASRFHEYQRMMEHWRKLLPAPMLEVDYEETVADLEGMARKLVAWCGLAWEPACLEFHQAKRPVRTASSVQVRQPVYKTSVARWKHYEDALGSLFARLERQDAQ